MLEPIDRVIRISSGGAGDDIEIVSTDEDIVKWFTEQVQALSKTVQVHGKENNVFFEIFPQVHGLMRTFRKMDYKQYAIGMLLIKELCHNGWEPYDAIGLFGGSISGVTLRRCREIKNN